MLDATICVELIVIEHVPRTTLNTVSLVPLVTRCSWLFCVLSPFRWAPLAFMLDATSFQELYTHHPKHNITLMIDRL